MLASYVVMPPSLMFTAVDRGGAGGGDGGGDGGADAFGGVLGIGGIVGKTSGGDVDRAKRFARCGSAERARIVAERTREAWAAHAARGPATGGGGI
mmetsp:Transcript_6120/g.23608  ORF Transcript_6120/g.23608 Transcript_6120/m.23608 type:complete len:96 (+) Transcript_6120:1515-1802(+)